MKSDGRYVVTPRGPRLGHALGVALVLASAWLVLEIGAWIVQTLTGGVQ